MKLLCRLGFHSWGAWWKSPVGKGWGRGCTHVCGATQSKTI